MWLDHAAVVEMRTFDMWLARSDALSAICMHVAVSQSCNTVQAMREWDLQPSASMKERAAASSQPSGAGPSGHTSPGGGPINGANPSGTTRSGVATGGDADAKMSAVPKRVVQLSDILAVAAGAHRVLDSSYHCTGFPSAVLHAEQGEEPALI
jgi:hypothetical protein